MRRDVVFGREMELAGSPLTLLYFQQAFGGDPLACYGSLFDAIDDLWIEMDEPLADAADGEKTEKGYVPNLLLFLKFAWAMAKTADKKTQPFELWLEEFDEAAFDLTEGAEAALVIQQAINAEIFRGRTPDAD